jgi:hypothetical protein
VFPNSSKSVDLKESQQKDGQSERGLITSITHGVMSGMVLSCALDLRFLLDTMCHFKILIVSLVFRGGLLQLHWEGSGCILTYLGFPEDNLAEAYTGLSLSTIVTRAWDGGSSCCEQSAFRTLGRRASLYEYVVLSLRIMKRWLARNSGAGLLFTELLLTVLSKDQGAVDCKTLWRRSL